MILGIEVFLLIVGLLALVRGKFNLGKGKDLVGGKARILGAVCMTPLPVALVLATVYAVYLASTGVDPGRLETDYRWHFVGLEAAVVIGIAIAVTVLGNSWYKEQVQERAAGIGPDEL